MSAALRPIVEVENLRFSYTGGGTVVAAIRDASLTVGHAEAVGLVGESGSGKSTLARALLGLTNPRSSRIDGGRIAIDGRDVTRFTPRQWQTMRGHPVAMMFQDPLTYLDPVMRIGRQIGESVRQHDCGVDVNARVRELLELVKLPPTVARAYPHELSGGMRQRVLLALALGCRPRILVADEPTSALDVTTQAEIMALLADLRRQLGMAILLISHDLGLVASACTRIYVMYAGTTLEWGETERVFRRPAHPYTDGLLRSASVMRGTTGRFATIEGDVPNLSHLIEGCPFRTRCPAALDVCTSMPASTAAYGDTNHRVRCWSVEKSARERGECDLAPI